MDNPNSTSNSTSTLTATTATAAAESAIAVKEDRRERIAGFSYLAVGVFIALVLGLSTRSGLNSAFGLSGGDRDSAFYLTLPARSTLLILGAVCAAIGAYQIKVHFTRRSVATIAIATIATFAFLVWATRGADFSLVGMLQTAVSRSTPLALGAMAGILCEKAGVVNIAIEGMMLFAAFGGVIGASATGNLWVGLLFGLASGAALAYLHAGLSITFRVDQIISGTVLNIFALGMTGFLASGLLRNYPDLNRAGTFRQMKIPVLSQIPVLGTVLFRQNIFVYLMYILVPLLTWALVRTRWGLRIRSVGEHPKAADTVGINVLRVRYRSVIMGGAMAGLAGSFLSLGSLGSFESNMTAGRGYIALAAMIFGRWNPVGALGAALLFGFAEALQTKLAIINTPIPSQFLLMAPYAVTLLVVAGFVGHSRAPAADGVPYVKG
ncbi:MAG: ABC transporter permease [Microthrixaceae bacterium]